MSFYEFKTEDAERFASMYPGARRNGNEIIGIACQIVYRIHGFHGLVLFH